VEAKEKAYLFLVRPLLEYASSAWYPYHKCDILNLEICQRRAARFVEGNYTRQASVTTMLQGKGKFRGVFAAAF